MTLDFGVSHREGTLAFPRADEDEAYARPHLAHNCGGIQQGRDALFPGQPGDRDDNLGVTQTKRITQLRRGLPLRDCTIETIEVDAGAGDENGAIRRDQSILLEILLVLAILENGRIAPPCRSTMQRALHGT